MGLDEIDATFYHLAIPLLRAFETASGRVAARHIGLVSVSGDGVTGWGEAAPYPGQDEPFDAVVAAARTGGVTPTLTAGIDEAVSDLAARERGESLGAALGEPATTVPISVAVGVGADSLSVVDKAVASGITRVKVKIVPDRTAHVSAIRRRFPDITIGVDANGSFDETSWRQILELSDLDVAYVEQPFESLTRREVEILATGGISVFADESVRSIPDVESVLANPGVAGVVVKPGRLGWQASVAAIEMARAASKQWRSSGLLETGIGRSYTEALAAAPDAYMSDVAPAEWFFEFDVVPSRVDGGRVLPATGLGNGLDVDASVVRAHAREIIDITGSVTRDHG